MWDRFKGEETRQPVMGEESANNAFVAETRQQIEWRRRLQEFVDKAQPESRQIEREEKMECEEDKPYEVGEIVMYEYNGEFHRNEIHVLFSRVEDGKKTYYYHIGREGNGSRSLLEFVSHKDLYRIEQSLTRIRGPYER